MSVAALKKKTESKYNSMSVGKKQFSINGTRRSQGYVGQTSLSRSLPRTLMKGNVAIGHGGCCGKFRKMPIVQSAVISLENPNVIKSSVLGTSGMISTKYQWVKRPQPYTSVKPDNNQNNNSQSDYITYLVDKTLNSNEYAKSDTLLLYPPLNTNTTYGINNVNNQEYGNGTYIQTTSLGTFSNSGPFYISANLYTNRYQPSDYNTNTGSTYNGIAIRSLSSTVNTTVSGVIYNGQWLQIEFPYRIKLTKLSLVPRIDYGNNVIYNYVLAGSNDNNSWNLILNANMVNYNVFEKKFVDLNPIEKYKSYRFIIVTALDRYPAISQLQFYSYDKYYCTKQEENTKSISCNINNINNNYNNNKLKTCTTNKPGLNYNYAIPCGEYMKRLINCRTKEDMFYVASKNNKQPFAGFN